MFYFIYVPINFIRTISANVSGRHNNENIDTERSSYQCVTLSRA